MLSAVTEAKAKSRANQAVGVMPFEGAGLVRMLGPCSPVAFKSSVS